MEDFYQELPVLAAGVVGECNQWKAQIIHLKQHVFEGDINSKKRLLLNPNKPVNHECKNFYEILDSRFYNEEAKLDLKVVFGDFLNSKS